MAADEQVRRVYLGHNFVLQITQLVLFTIDIIMQRNIITGIAENSNHVKRKIDIVMIKNLNLLSWNLRFLNFNENILILDTNAKDIRMVIINSISGILNK